MKKLSSLLLALAGSLACSGANGVPSHIVQPLPRELDPRLEQPLTPPSHIVRPLTEEETARRERELAPVPTAGLKEDGEKAIQTYSAQEKTVDGRIQEFRQQHQVAGNTPAPAAETTPSSAASGPEEGFLQANSPKDLYTVDCDGDLYFDMEEGVLVFMKNVRVRNPGLSMDCADHLKIYAEFVPKKPGDKKPSDIKKEKGKEGDQTQVALPNGGNFDYNSIKTVAASGNVKASYTNKQGETSNAQAEKITYNAKTSRPSVCNAAESLLIDEAAAQSLLPRIAARLAEKDVTLYGCEKTRAILGETVLPATDEDYGKEYLDYAMSVKVA